jgi:hypothetical protein
MKTNRFLLPSCLLQRCDSPAAAPRPEWAYCRPRPNRSNWEATVDVEINLGAGNLELKAFIETALDAAR